MPDLNPAQFSQVFSQMGEMDSAHPTPSYQQHKDKPLYHGTPHDIKDTVLPAIAANKTPSDESMGDPGDLSEGDHAFATHDESYAWHASQFHRTNERARVYETGAVPDMKPGPWNKEHPDYLAHHGLPDPEKPEAFGAKRGDLNHQAVQADARLAMSKHQPEYASATGFPVRKRIDIMPGRQGTFPEINWNNHKLAMTRGMGSDANHPDDASVRHSTAPVEKIADAPEHLKPKRRSGASLRAFINGDPEPKPKPEPTLF